MLSLSWSSCCWVIQRCGMMRIIVFEAQLLEWLECVEIKVIESILELHVTGWKSCIWGFDFFTSCFIVEVKWIHLFTLSWNLCCWVIHGCEMQRIIAFEAQWLEWLKSLESRVSILELQLVVGCDPYYKRHFFMISCGD